MKRLTKAAVATTAILAAAAFTAPHLSGAGFALRTQSVLPHRAVPATRTPLMNGQRGLHDAAQRARRAASTACASTMTSARPATNTERGMECYGATRAQRGHHAALVDLHHAAGPGRAPMSTRSRCWRRATASRPWPTGGHSNGPSIRPSSYWDGARSC